MAHVHAAAASQLARVRRPCMATGARTCALASRGACCRKAGLGEMLLQLAIFSADSVSEAHSYSRGFINVNKAALDVPAAEQRRFTPHLRAAIVSNST